LGGQDEQDGQDKNRRRPRGQMLRRFKNNRRRFHPGYLSARVKGGEIFSPAPAFRG
jgi:hypothetical protein